LQSSLLLSLLLARRSPPPTAARPTRRPHTRALRTSGSCCAGRWRTSRIRRSPRFTERPFEREALGSSCPSGSGSRSTSRSGARSLKRRGSPTPCPSSWYRSRRQSSGALVAPPIGCPPSRTRASSVSKLESSDEINCSDERWSRFRCGCSARKRSRPRCYWSSFSALKES